MFIGLRVKYRLFLCDLNLDFLDGFSKRIQVSNFMKICPVGSEFLHADRRTHTHTHTHTDMMNLIVVFRSFSNASKTRQPVSSGIMHRVRRSWSMGPTLEMFGKGKGRISPVISYAPCYEVNGDSGGVDPRINIGTRCR